MAKNTKYPTILAIFAPEMAQNPQKRAKKKLWEKIIVFGKKSLTIFWTIFLVGKKLIKIFAEFFLG